MNDITVFYPMITECVVNVVRAVIAIVFGVLVIPWVKNSAIPWLKERQLYGMICKFVRAAEKLAEGGLIDKATKLDYVCGLLKRCGVEVTPEVRALIESAVGDLDDEFSNNIQNLADVILNAKDEIAATHDVCAEDVNAPEEPACDDGACAVCEIAPAEGDAE